MAEIKSQFAKKTSLLDDGSGFLPSVLGALRPCAPPVFEGDMAVSFSEGNGWMELQKVHGVGWSDVRNTFFLNTKNFEDIRINHSRGLGVFQSFFCLFFAPNVLGKWSNLTKMLQLRWNHLLDIHSSIWIIFDTTSLKIYHHSKTMSLRLKKWWPQQGNFSCLTAIWRAGHAVRRVLGGSSQLVSG